MLNTLRQFIGLRRSAESVRVCSAEPDQLGYVIAYTIHQRNLLDDRIRKPSRCSNAVDFMVAAASTRFALSTSAPRVPRGAMSYLGMI